MIKNLSIRNFKSVQKLDINNCKRVNVFIGEYNSGKSNILEALSFLSANALEKDFLNDIFRYKNARDFFYDSDTNSNIDIKTDEMCFQLRYSKRENGNLNNNLQGVFYEPALIDLDNLNQSGKKYIKFTMDFSGEIKNVETHGLPTSFRTYQFKRLKSFKEHYVPILNPPYGDNIPSLLLGNKAYKDLVSSIIKTKGLMMNLKPTENDIEVAKEVDDIFYTYPYSSISETLQRIIFYTLAIETNKNSTLIFDELDSNTFPMYTKQMAELIAADSTNQYFIATHNPYLLGSLVSKTPMNQISVFVTSMENFQTVIKEVPERKLSTLLDSGIDVFFNLDKLTED